MSCENCPELIGIMGQEGICRVFQGSDTNDSVCKVGDQRDYTDFHEPSNFNKTVGRLYHLKDKPLNADRRLMSRCPEVNKNHASAKRNNFLNNSNHDLE